MKCLDCGTKKPESAFFLNRPTKDGTQRRRAICIKCYKRGPTEKALRAARLRSQADYNGRRGQ